MVKIRLKRFGAKKTPHYRIVVTDSRRARDGAYLESLGSYNPRGVQSFSLNEERLDYWLTQGAKMSARVKSLLKVRRTETGLAPAEEAPQSEPEAKKTTTKTKEPTKEKASKKVAAEKSDVEKTTSQKTAEKKTSAKKGVKEEEKAEEATPEETPVKKSTAKESAPDPGEVKTETAPSEGGSDEGTA